ncbi:uncharacterized protein V6R79_002824 [Siganus canaliculatus]
MRSFILVAVLLQLAAIITHTTAQYQFGDIIAFPVECLKTSKKSFIRYGIYVGGSDAPNVLQGENDILYVSGNKLRSCTFDKVHKVRKGIQELRFNDLDELEGLTPKSKEEMVAKIKELLGLGDSKTSNFLNKIKGHCKKFNINYHNSEFLATLVRYGERIALQLDGKLERLGEEKAELKPETRQKLESIECNSNNPWGQGSGVRV